MGVEIDVVYEGKLHTSCVHGPSKTKLSTDAPVDNGGKGESFSPTDLVATALGACMVTIMGIVAERQKLDIAGTTVRVIKEMIQQPERRIGALRVTITVPNSSGIDEANRKRLEAAAHHCPVHKSLHPDIDKPIEFRYA